MRRKQKPPTGKGTQSDPLQLGSEEEETETKEVKQATKHKPDDDDDNKEEDDDFETFETSGEKAKEKVITKFKISINA